MILAGRVGRSEAAWAHRIELAERLGALVVTDLKAAAFPTTHPLHGAPAGVFPGEQTLELLTAAADVVLALDWIDLAGVDIRVRPGYEAGTTRAMVRPAAG